MFVFATAVVQILVYFQRTKPRVMYVTYERRSEDAHALVMTTPAECPSHNPESEL